MKKALVTIMVIGIMVIGIMVIGIGENNVISTDQNYYDEFKEVFDELESEPWIEIIDTFKWKESMIFADGLRVNDKDLYVLVIYIWKDGRGVEACFKGGERITDFDIGEVEVNIETDDWTDYIDTCYEKVKNNCERVAEIIKFEGHLVNY